MKIHCPTADARCGYCARECSDFETLADIQICLPCWMSLEHTDELVDLCEAERALRDAGVNALAA